jgi:hypothetical protein
MPMLVPDRIEKTSGCKTTTEAGDDESSVVFPFQPYLKVLSGGRVILDYLCLGTLHFALAVVDL